MLADPSDRRDIGALCASVPTWLVRVVNVEVLRYPVVNELPPTVCASLKRVWNTSRVVIDADLNASHRLPSRAAAVLQATHARHGGPAECSAPSAARGALAPWQLDRILIYIEENIAEPLPNTDLARLIGLSTSHFSRAFSGRAGISPARYVRRRRVELACRLMSSTRISLCQIAIESGLCDQAHLCRTFRTFFRETPSAWRRANTIR